MAFGCSKFVCSLLGVFNIALTLSAFGNRFDFTVYQGGGVDIECGDLPYVHANEITKYVYDKCLFLGLHLLTAERESILLELMRVFQNDSSVFVGVLENSNNTHTVQWTAAPSKSSKAPHFAFYARETRDRSCLLLPAKETFFAEPYQGVVALKMLVQYVNEKCGAFRSPTGGLTNEGLLHEHIMQQLYLPSEPVEQCQKLKYLPTKVEFFQDFLFRSKPVILENAISGWPAMKKWTMDYLLQQYGEKEVHIKLTPDGIFEGVESAKMWSEYSDNWIPESVRAQLPYPDLVVVRPATRELKFSDFLNFISSRNRTFSAYLEYSSIPYYMPKLQQDTYELPFVEGSLTLQHLNMWLSDGNTLGKLHFDPFDNFLCQMSGEKHLTLFDPHHNENLYEAHIPEALLSFNQKMSTFHRHTLLESTSMVMSPVDIVNADLQRFPKFSAAGRLQCSLRPGDVLFMPAFWWHEVQSQPDPVEGRNMAVNFWYNPVFTKEFPCPECRLAFNMDYRHLLHDSAGL